MSRRRKFVVAFIVLAGISVGVVCFLWPREPVYGGRKLSYWIDQWVHEGPGHAESVLLTVGITNKAVWPEAMRRKHRLIIKQLQTKDSVFWKPYTRLKDKSPSFVSKLLPAWPEPAQTRLAALNIFNHGPFGRDAFIRQAIPSLFRIAKQDPQPNIRLAAIAAIGRLGHLSDGAMPLLCSFAETDPDSHIRSAAIRAMSHLADSSSSAVRIMLRALCSDELHDRECAARWFGRTTLIPEKAVPELVRRLEDPGMKSEAATALTRYAAKAQFAVPRLIELAKSSDRDISSVAVWALLAIDRDAAAGAGIKAY